MITEFDRLKPASESTVGSQLVRKWWPMKLVMMAIHRTRVMASAIVGEQLERGGDVPLLVGDDQLVAGAELQLGSELAQDGLGLGHATAL